MLHEHVRMSDIDVDQWRNLQTLVLDSARSKRRIVCIHEQGQVLKLAHSEGTEIQGRVDQVDDATAVARSLHEANADTTDLVVVLERDAVDDYYARVQDSWSIDEDLDVFVQRIYALLDDDGIVTWPGPARDHLGLQFRLGAGLDDIRDAVARHVPPGSHVVFGVVEDGALWTSLVLGFDDDRRITEITTAEPSALDTADPHADALVAWTDDRHGNCALALVVDRVDAAALLARTDKTAGLRELQDDGRLLGARLTESLAADLR